MPALSLFDLPPPSTGRSGWPWTEGGMVFPIEMTPSGAWPRISVITPSFNQAPYLEETLRSILLQGYPNLETIVVDGGSTDGSVAILEKYAPFLTSWSSEKDRGQSDAINRGFRRSTGEIVGWLNSDDLYFPGALQAVARGFSACPGAGLVYGAGAKVAADRTLLKTIPFRPVNLARLRRLFYLLQPSSFVHRRALDAVGLLDERLHYVMDWDWVLRIAQKFPLHAIEEPIAMLRDYPETKTRTPSDARWFELVRIARKFNGPMDRNVLVFWLLYGLRGLRRSRVGSGFWERADHWTRRALGRIWSEDTYMAHAFR